MTTEQRDSQQTALAVGRRAADALAEALDAAGFSLPSLSGGFPLMGTAQVELGGLSAVETLRLARWIQERVR
ncbi:hypothetical protein QMK19_10770 [Streptomyces sp. H10-C2]|uniref:hypothetical protein n=1 Tax=unclassified Streptomyces TaxID=2593676 RepID=UPI0024B8D71C|nr:MULTISPECIES: hypothetical protein [unclassified Streptomyces]MDJ0340492.1 hypothetical protein [Streptomyces sp. PH10-H1]MDJ0370140.1 hypothetical protein [Streptomyces sp. H10-C2]